MNAFRDLIGGFGKAADVVFLGGAVGKTRSRNKFTDFLEQGDFQAAEELALRKNEPGYAQFARERGAEEAKRQAEQSDAETKFFVGSMRSLLNEKDPQRRLDIFNALAPIAKRIGADDDDLAQFASILDDDQQIAATIAGFGGDLADDETFGVAPQFIRGPDGKVKAVQFGNRGTIRSQDAGGVPLPLELRQIQVDQGQQRINQAYELADPQLKGAQGFATGQGIEAGKQTASAQFNLPRVTQNAQQTIELIDTAVNHPGFKSRYGLRSFVPAVRGTDGADFDALRDQIRGKAFLQAFETLKGGGQITEIEGVKATEAITRALDPKQSPEAARAAFLEFRNIIELGVLRAQQQAATQNPFGASDPRAPNPNAPRQDATQFNEGQTATNPQTGQKIIFRNGQWEPAQ